jgi:flagellar hook-associated protein 2
MSTTGPVVSVAGSTTASGAGGSVINVSSLVAQLVAATRAPQDALIANQTKAVTTKISALGALKSALSTFQSSLAPLMTSASFNAQTATSSSQSVFTATAGSSAVRGTYSLTVSQLATAQQLVSKPFAGGSSTVVGTGTLQVALGASSFSVAINSTNNTLAGIAAAINTGTGNPGVTATIVTGTDGAHLVLSSSLTGSANNIQVTETDGGTGLASLTYSSGSPGNYTQNTAPQNASFTLAGVAYTSASNTVANALTGVNLNLLATNVGSTATLTVASNTATVQTNIANFVAAYNQLVTATAPLGSYDATTQTAGPMLGDPVLTTTQNQIRGTLNGSVSTGSSTYNTLASIGVTANKDGTLSLNSATLSTALATNFGAVSQLFSSAKGVGATLNNQLAAALGSGGAVGARAITLSRQNTALTTQTNTLNTQMGALTTSLTRQYSTLNALLSSLQSTSAYLTQSFANLPNVPSSSSK